jgi:hypothetical protein
MPTENVSSENFKKIASARVLANKSFNKCFCIGYNKTGTTTLEATLRLYGYSLPSQSEQEIRLTKNAFETNYRPFVDFVSKYDAFQDMPFSQNLTFVVADALFPGSKFILSIRESDVWFRSLVSYHRKIFGIDPARTTEKDVYKKLAYLYEGYVYQHKKRLLTTFIDNKPFVNWSMLYNKDYYIKMYEERNRLIQQYFVDSPDKLLVIDVTKETTTKKICDFLSIPNDLVIKMPHLNKT